MTNNMHRTLFVCNMIMSDSPQDALHLCCLWTQPVIWLVNVERLFGSMHTISENPIK